MVVILPPIAAEWPITNRPAPATVTLPLIVPVKVTVVVPVCTVAIAPDKVPEIVPPFSVALVVVATNPAILPPDWVNVSAVSCPAPFTVPPVCTSPPMVSAPDVVKVPVPETVTTSVFAIPSPSFVKVPVPLTAMALVLVSTDPALVRFRVPLATPRLAALVIVPVTSVVVAVTLIAPAPFSAPAIVPPCSACAPEDVTVLPDATVAPPDWVKVAAMMLTVPAVAPPDWANAPVSVCTPLPPMMPPVWVMAV